MADLKAQETTIEGRSTVIVSGQLTINTAPELRSVLMKYVKRRRASLLLDLSGVEFMDTSGLATLIEAHLQAERNRGTLVLFGLRPRIADVFKVTRVTSLFKILDTQEAALEALKGDGQ
jgi:anti-sigma B factor antagonist